MRLWVVLKPEDGHAGIYMHALCSGVSCGSLLVLPRQNKKKTLINKQRMNSILAVAFKPYLKPDTRQLSRQDAWC